MSGRADEDHRGPAAPRNDHVRAVDPPDDMPIGPSAVSGGMEGELRSWWLRLAESECAAVIPKAVEYSAADLEIMGFVLATCPPVPSSSVSPSELACAFYALGKIARAFGAYAEGRRPSDDCWHDLGVYVRMIQRIRTAGGWPGTDG